MAKIEFKTATSDAGSLRVCGVTKGSPEKVVQAFSSQPEVYGLNYQGTYYLRKESPSESVKALRIYLGYEWIKTIALDMTGFSESEKEAFIVELLLAPLEPIFLLAEEPLNFSSLQSLTEGIKYARFLTAQPPNRFYPAAYAAALKDLESLGVTVKVLGKQELQALGMEGILAVGQGSSHEPQLAILEWNLKPDVKPIALVGKGVCFDSGGICLKAKAAMSDMKWDKAGAGVVAGVIKTLALTKSPQSVVGILGLVENMPGSGALKPGDILEMGAGCTVEVVDTDAEGRLVLADGLTYARKTYQPCCLIDLGTLTVETMAALGGEYAGLFGNDPALIQKIKAASVESGEGVWELPMGPFFRRQIASDVADIKNSGTDLFGECGAAAEFLRCFAGDVPWVHLDIAGVSWTFEPGKKEVTGFGVKLLTRALCCPGKGGVNNPFEEPL